MSHVIIKSIPFTTQIKQGARHILAHDKARAQKLVQGLHPHGPLGHKATAAGRHRHHHHHKHHPVPEPTPNDPPEPAPAPPSGDPDAAKDSIDVTDAGVTYTMSVGVGSPATQYTLLIDTGSSNTWVGAGKAYKQTSTSKSTRNSVNVTYGSGSFSGTEFTDEVTLGSLVIKNQSIGVASKANGFQDVDGILGIGPVDLTEGTVSNTPNVPTVTQNMFTQKLIPTESIGISYEPTTSDGALNGELTFGSVDTSKTTSDVTFVPITSTSPASNYWGIDQTISYGQDSSPLLTSSGIVDTGTTLLLIATDAFNAYQKATGATLDQTTGLLTVTEEQFSNMQSLFFNIGGTTFEFTPNAQIWPRSQNSQLGGEEGKIYLITSDLGNNSGTGLDFINGFAFLQRFYSVYDTTNAQVGLATTPFTNAETN
ncbi:Polyporopepsin [Psilocybe cubensis]|uniref:Polyporopepsin n=2 Tax=Psilocybe cubensis TaxID=181762 RepID=A0ACB8GZP3_PSICU|nr:Polyporopepsin [Psilocybe cubensis]KAH9480701.1 Polyporopepsin [Psilocybe cubensis]